MSSKSKLLLFVTGLSLVFATFAFANTKTSHSVYSLKPRKSENGKDSGIEFKIPFTFGIHNGKAHQFQGSFELDQNDFLQKIQVTLPISKIETGNSTRDCHLRESLGIDYSHQQSIYPSKHVCNSKNELPVQGNDSIAFPEIKLSLVQVLKSTPLPIPLNKKTKTTLLAELEIHGIKKTFELEVEILKTQPTPTTENIEIQTTFDVSLADFAILVKPVNLLLTKISVGEIAQVTVHLVGSLKTDKI